MSYITSERLQSFMRKYVDEDGESLIETYCKGAEDVIKKYLGYDPEGSTLTYKRRGEDGYVFKLPAKPINSITSVKVNGVAVSTDLFEVVEPDQNYIQYADGVTEFLKDNVYEFVYSAGYVPEEIKTTDENDEEVVTYKSTVPYIIQLTALQIASLLWESSGGNLAVSSTSFADTGSRVFNNFTLDRFLNQIAEYKLQI